MKKGFKKALLMLLSLVMVFTMMPLATMTAFADDAEGGITVYMTVSNQGVLAKANDGSAMALKEVTVADLDGDGHYTFDEAIAAAHKAYNSEDGYAVSSSGWVTTLWGVADNPASYSFMKNDQPTDVVTNVEVEDQDKLTISVNQDTTYTDWYSYFDQKNVEVKPGESFTLNLSGFQAMSTNAPAPASGVSVGTWSDGSFNPMEGVSTDESGNVTLSFNEEGTYIISASGKVSETYDAETNYQLMKVEHDKDGRDVYGKMDWNTSESWVGYTEKDYEDGPYPWSEIQWMELFDEDYEPVYDAETFDSGYLLYTGMITMDCSIIAPCSIVKVAEPVYSPGWHKIDGDWYYYDENSKMVTSTWKKDSKGWVYLGEDGKMVTNDWAKDSKGWVYVGADGYMVTGTKWLKADGIWYHITNGYRDQSKWMKDSKGWCYLGADGAMVTNDFAKDSKGWCYIGSAGYMVEKTQWVKVDGDWYHITKGYRDQSKWMKDSKGWCYLGADGAMVTNDWAKDGKGYCWIGPEGYMVEQTKWFQIGEDWYHITKGYRDQSKWMKDSKGWCYLGADGKMVTEDWAKDSKGYCWIGTEGYMVEEDMWIGPEGELGSSYIVKGYRVDGKTIVIDEKEYTFDNNGKLIVVGADKIPYAGNTVNFIKANGSQFGMFTPQEGTTVALDGDNVVIHYIPKNTTTYAGFNWGTIENEVYKNESAQPKIEVKPNEDGSYDLTLSKDYMGYAHPLAVVKNTFSKDSWTSAEQYYLAVPMITEPVELAITNNTTMFNAVSASIVKEGGQEYLVMALNGTGYKELFKGTYEEAVANGDGSKDNGNDSWIHAYTNEAGKLEFKIPVDEDESYVPCVAISNSYYTKYLNGQNPLERAFFSRQFEIDRQAKTLVTGDYDHSVELAVTNNVSMFKPGDKAVLRTVGGPNNNEYGNFITLNMGSGSYTKVKAKKYTNRGAAFVEDGTIEIELGEGNVFADIPVLVNGETNVLEFWSANKQQYYKRDLTIDLEAGTATFDPHKATIDDIEGLTEEEAIAYVTDNANVDLLNSLIEAIQVQYRDENTDLYCAAAKACWDALSEEDQQEDDGYFSDDTGNASLDDPLNTAPEKDKELLVVSFGTSFNDSRVATIGAIEKALAAAYGDEYDVRRAFTAQIIINHVQARDGEKIDNVTQAMDKAVAAGVKEMVVQPTHLMSGAEYDELKAEIDKYAGKISITYAKPLLDSDADKQAVAQAVVAAAVEDAGYASLEAAATDGVAFVFMGHGTSHEANVTYNQMQQTMNTLGYANCFIGTVEGIPEETALPEVKKAVEAKEYTKVVLRPLMVVAGDHANNDMAADEEGSWYYAFVNGGEFEVEGKDEAVDIGEGFGAANVTCQINGLGEIAAIQQLYVAHVEAVLS